MTGWRQIGDKQYYFNEDGTMATGWITLNGKSYLLREDGSLDNTAVKQETPQSEKAADCFSQTNQQLLFFITEVNH